MKKFDKIIEEIQFERSMMGLKQKEAIIIAELRKKIEHIIDKYLDNEKEKNKAIKEIYDLFIKYYDDEKL